MCCYHLETLSSGSSTSITATLYAQLCSRKKGQDVTYCPADPKTEQLKLFKASPFNDSHSKQSYSADSKRGFCLSSPVSAIRIFRIKVLSGQQTMNIQLKAFVFIFQEFLSFLHATNSTCNRLGILSDAMNSWAC